MEYAVIKFTNAWTDETVAQMRVECPDNFDVMKPYFNEEKDKWIVGKQYGYFWGSSTPEALFSFSYAGNDKQQGTEYALEAFADVQKVLGSNKKNNIQWSEDWTDLMEETA